MTISAVISQPFSESTTWEGLELAYDMLKSIPFVEVIVVHDLKYSDSGINRYTNLCRYAINWKKKIKQVVVDEYGTGRRWRHGIHEAFKNSSVQAVLNFPGDSVNITNETLFAANLQKLIETKVELDLVVGDWTSNDPFKKNFFDDEVVKTVIETLWGDELASTIARLNISKHRSEFFRISRSLFEHFHNNPFEYIWPSDPTLQLIIAAIRRHKATSPKSIPVDKVILGEFSDSPSTRDVFGQTDQIVRFISEAVRCRMLQLKNDSKVHLGIEVTDWKDHQTADYPEIRNALIKLVEQASQILCKVVNKNFDRIDHDLHRAEQKEKCDESNLY